MVSGEALVAPRSSSNDMPNCKLDNHLAAPVKYLPVGMMAGRGMISAAPDSLNNSLRSRGIVAFIGGGQNSEQCLPSFEEIAPLKQ